MAAAGAVVPVGPYSSRVVPARSIGSRASLGWSESKHLDRVIRFKLGRAGKRDHLASGGPLYRGPIGVFDHLLRARPLGDYLIGRSGVDQVLLARLKFEPVEEDRDRVLGDQHPDLSGALAVGVAVDGLELGGQLSLHLVWPKLSHLGGESLGRRPVASIPRWSNSCP